MDRRALLKALAAAPLAATFTARAAPARPRLLVMVFLYGGNDGLNTWVPLSDPLYRELRPTIAVPRDAVLKVTDHHGFHPSLAALMPAWDARELAVLQGIGYPETTQQHYRDIEIAFTAADRELRDDGWVGRALAKAARRDAVAFDVLDIRAQDPMGPFRGDRVAAVQVHHAQELLAAKRIAACAIETNAGGAKIAAQLPAIGERVRTAFPSDPFGTALRAAAELAAADATLPVIHVTLNGLDGDKHHSVDTHWKQLEYHGDALKRLAEGLAAFRTAMRDLGRWDDTLVVTYDEFGRSPVENADRGTHHGAANTHVALGGRVNGGVYGSAPRIERVFQVGGPAPTLDTRSVWSAVARDHWGVAEAGLFDRSYPVLPLLRT